MLLEVLLHVLKFDGLFLVVLFNNDVLQPTNIYLWIIRVLWRHLPLELGQALVNELFVSNLTLSLLDVRKLGSMV